MRYYRRAAYLILALVLILFSSINYAFPAKPRTVSEATVVKVSVAEGHGSGVNIGNGYIVTAAHVPGEAATVKIKTSGGKEFDADVLWVNHVYDVALLRADPKALGGGSQLDCRTAKAGDQIQAAGNPLDLEFVSSFGRVAGDMRELGPWKEVLITDTTIVMGQSGGPIFEPDGRVIGIAVGVMPVPLPGPLGPTPSLTGYGTVVPSSTICMLLGRSS